MFEETQRENEIESEYIHINSISKPPSLSQPRSEISFLTIEKEISILFDSDHTIRCFNSSFYCLVRITIHRFLYQRHLTGG